MRMKPSRAGATAALLLAMSLGAPGAARANGPAAGLEGLWEGLMLYKPAEVEVEFTAELARAADGKLVGTIDLPNQHLVFYPLDRATLKGNTGTFAFTWRGPDMQSPASVTFTGTLSPDGKRFSGEVVESDVPGARVPFSMIRVADAGTPRKEARQAKLVVSAAGAELKESFNRDAGKTRLVMLLSPT